MLTGIYHACVVDLRHTVDHDKLFERGIREVLNMVGIRHDLICTINGNEIPARCDVVAVRNVGRVVLLGYDLVGHGRAVPKHVDVIH